MPRVREGIRRTGKVARRRRSLPCLRGQGGAQLVGLHVFRHGKTGKKVFGQLQNVRRLPLKEKESRSFGTGFSISCGKKASAAQDIEEKKLLSISAKKVKKYLKKRLTNILISDNMYKLSMRQLAFSVEKALLSKEIRRLTTA